MVLKEQPRCLARVDLSLLAMSNGADEVQTEMGDLAGLDQPGLQSCRRHLRQGERAGDPPA